MSRWILAVIAMAGLLSMPGCQCIHAFEQWKCNHLGWCDGGTRPICPPPVTVPYGTEKLPPPQFVPGELPVVPGEPAYLEPHRAPPGDARPLLGTKWLRLPSTELPLPGRSIKECNHQTGSPSW
jgi:hypothetical protein